ncbi:hypothetical protein [Sorangium sp. So ce362]|uniref:hypothetical protein n=1 Tax=Sorangium sp. So ce362 TaxID=3133303 RepID=UPI003F600AC3
MRHIVKGAEPATVTETRTASTTDLSTTTRARTAFDQIDKGRVRADLAREQGWLCAFCMRRIDPDTADARGERTMKIAHRTPIDVDPAQALSWRNLLGSCDGGQRSGWRTRSCDAAQGSTALTVDPTVQASCAQLRFERRDTREGLFITSNHPGIKTDVEQTLGLNSGDLPVLREQVWKAFYALQQKHAPKQYGRAARAAFFPTWMKQHGSRLPEMLGVIEERLR